MLGCEPGACLLKTKNANPATKMSDLLNGHIQRRRVRCGKKNCKCARGEKHTAFYHVWHCGGFRFQKYVRRSQVENVRQACQAYRDLQIKLRCGRIEHKLMMARFRQILRDL